ncbi:MAG: TetR/AcrR family transcriptional regulator [Actinobacteria bacterium]|nr:MAG: TetR/AcrR family transcriptional regulator [Actinomycetota bacterium]
MAATRVYGGQSADERTEARRQRLMDAALELMGTEGWPGTSVRAVCREAALTPRFFYESFEDLDALAVAVFDDIAVRATAAILEAVHGAPAEPAAQARAAIATFVDQLTGDPRRARVAFAEALGNEALARRRLQAMRAMAQLIAAHGRAAYGAPPEADTLVEITASLLAGGIAELLIAWLDGAIDATRDELVADCAALFMVTAEGAAAIGRERARRASARRR